jgi:hypothetical protein
LALRKKYQQENVALASPPQEAAAQPSATEPPLAEAAPPAAETPLPAEPFAKPSAGEEAAQTAMKERLAETERAHTLTPPQPAPQYTHEVPQPQQPSPEQIIANSGLPDRAKTWLRRHPDYIEDPVKNQTLIALHAVAARQAGSEWTDAYFARMDDLLGFRPQPRPQANGNGSQQVRQQQPPYREPYRGAPVSAPISREVPSFSTGRAQNFRPPLTALEREIALTSRLPGQADEQALRMYQHNKERVQRMRDKGKSSDRYTLHNS